MTEKKPKEAGVTSVTHVNSAGAVRIGGGANRESGKHGVSQTIELVDGGSMRIDKSGGGVLEIEFKNGVVTVRDQGVEKKHRANHVEVRQGGGRHTIFLDGLELA